MTTAITPLTLSQLHPSHDLQQALSTLEGQVRARPNAIEIRWALVEFLCVLGQWERALKQLQTAVQLVSVSDPQGAHWQSKAQLVRGLIKAQAQRSAVFAGTQQPVPVIDAPQWMQDLAGAIVHNAQGRAEQADVLRDSALEAAPTRAGICTVERQGEESSLPYQWISDTDTRLGPVCELIIAGGYRWLAFADIADLQIQPPASLLHLVWTPVTLQLRATQAAGKTLHAYIPTRYCGTETSADEHGQAQHNALLLSHLTLWRDVGDTGVFAYGQKTLMTDQGDISLLDVRQLHSEDRA